MEQNEIQVTFKKAYDAVHKAKNNPEDAIGQLQQAIQQCEHGKNAASLLEDALLIEQFDQLKNVVAHAQDAVREYGRSSEQAKQSVSQAFQSYKDVQQNIE